MDEKTAATTATSSIDEAKIMRAINESVEQMANIGKRKKKDNGKINDRYV